uniref:Uncharacterized protein n=1 Tax=Anguilla anguilla TaxID=7936 RepID=A0A0E9SGT1_ANGAN
MVTLKHHLPVETSQIRFAVYKHKRMTY